MKKIYTLLSVVFLLLLLTGCAKEMVLKDFQNNPGKEVAGKASTWFEYSDEQKEKLITEKMKKEELSDYPAKEIVEGIDHLYANTEYTLDEFEEAFNESVESYERVVAFEEENPSSDSLAEKTAEEERLEEDLQEFIDVYTQAFRNEDAETIYDTWDSSIDSDAERREEEIKNWQEELEVSEIKEYRAKFIKIMEDSPVEEHGIEYIKVLADLKIDEDYQGEKVRYEGLAVMYITEYDNEYGYLIEDDMDYLDEEQAEQFSGTK